MNDHIKTTTTTEPDTGNNIIEVDFIKWLLKHQAWDRLSKVKQNGPVYKHFPGMMQTRNIHSWGVMITTKDHFETLKKTSDPRFFDFSPEITEEGIRECLCIAASCHDIGHGPYSHSFEGVSGIDHEIQGQKIMEVIIEEYNQDKIKEGKKEKIMNQKKIDFINDLIIGNNNYPFYENKFNNQEELLDFINNISNVKFDSDNILNITSNSGTFKSKSYGNILDNFNKENKDKMSTHLLPNISPEHKYLVFRSDPNLLEEKIENIDLSSFNDGIEDLYSTDYIIFKYEEELYCVKNNVFDEFGKDYLFQIVANHENEIDSDGGDYGNRDSSNANGSRTMVQYDYRYIINHSKILMHKGQSMILFNEKVSHQCEWYFFNRMDLTLHIYFAPLPKILEKLYQDMLICVKDNIYTKEFNGGKLDDVKVLDFIDDNDTKKSKVNKFLTLNDSIFDFIGNFPYDLINDELVKKKYEKASKIFNDRIRKQNLPEIIEKYRYTNNIEKNRIIQLLDENNQNNQLEFEYIYINIKCNCKNGEKHPFDGRTMFFSEVESTIVDFNKIIKESPYERINYQITKLYIYVDWKEDADKFSKKITEDIKKKSREHLVNLLPTN